MSTSTLNSDEAERETLTSSAAELQQRISVVESNHPALIRLRQKIEGRSSDSSVLTDYSRMHHRHNRD